MTKRWGFRLFALLAAVTLLFALSGCSEEEEPLPNPTEAFFVNDFAEILSEEQESAIFEAGKKLQTATNAQVVLVTVEDTGSRDLETYSLELARKWGVGQEETNNGILLLFTVDGPHSRIEVGYGLEGAMNDAKAGRILDTYLVPAYEDEAKWGSALANTYTAILNVVYEEYGMADQTVPLPEPEEEPLSAADLWLIIPILLVILVIAFRVRHGGVVVIPGGFGGGFRGGFGGGFGGGGGFRGGGGGFGGGGASR